MFKKLVCLLVSAVLAGTFSVYASAEEEIICSHGRRTFKDHYLTGGVGNYGNSKRYFWVSTSSAADKSMIKGYRPSGGVDNIGNAFDYWTNTSPGYPNITTSISWRETNTKSSASIEFYGYYMGNTSDARTVHLLYDDSVDATKKNWGWCKIYIDPDSASKLSERAETGTVVHEIGHAMGLSHQLASKRKTTSIMYPQAAGRKMEDGTTDRNKPSSIDCNNIRHIYDGYDR